MFLQEVLKKIPGKVWLAPVLGCLLALWFVGGALSSWIAVVTLERIGTPPVPVVESSGRVEVKQAPRKDFDELVQRNPFGVMIEELAPPPPAPVTGVVEDQLVVTKLPALLVGTMAGSDLTSLCLIQDTRNRSTEIYAVGDMVLGMAKVLRIERERVILDRNGTQEVLVVPEDPTHSTTGRTAKPAVRKNQDSKAPEPPVEVRDDGDGNFVLDKEDFNAMLTDLGPLLSSARVVPNFEKGKINGYKIFAIRSGSLYESIGMKNGDIIDGINGLKVETPDKALMMFQQLRSEEHFELDIRRGGEPMSFNYDLE